MSTPAQRLRAKRQQRWRQRQRHDTAVLTVEVPHYHRVVDALIVTGAIGDREALNRAEVARVIGGMLAAWSHEWSK